MILSRQKSLLRLSAVWLLALIPALWLAADLNADERQEARKRLVGKAIAYLKTHGQAEDGSFSRHAGPGVTALVATSMLRNGVPVSDPTVAKALAYLEKFRQEDGGIYQKDTLYRNYETCLSVMCFSAANRDGRYDSLLQGADQFIKSIQWDGSEGIESSDPAYGGAGYGKHKRPDLSNTTFMVEALRELGNEADSESLQRALTFISRCQNLESPHNTTPHAAKNPDGGFYYTAAAGGSSQAGTTANGGLRSYASMTYAGLKSMLFAGVKSDDPRVQAALGWLRKNYDLKSNPGMGDSGLFYYYHTFAKTMAAANFESFQDAEGTAHDWRQDLIDELGRRQLANGSWVNQNARWLEDDPNLVTAYALLALAFAG